jgi:hypothetical protein
MTAKSRSLGHDIYFNDVWRWSDNNIPLTEESRACKKCSLYPIFLDADTGQGADACLGVIEGVKAACCGHGIDEDSYIDWEDTK